MQISLPIFNQYNAIDFHPTDFWSFKTAPFKIYNLFQLFDCWFYLTEGQVDFRWSYISIVFAIVKGLT